MALPTRVSRGFTDPLDLIGDDAGIRVAPGDTAALAEAMLRLTNDPELRRQMGAAAQERYQKLFSPKVVMPLMLDIYRRVVRNGHTANAIASGNGNLHPWAESLNGKSVKPGSIQLQPSATSKTEPDSINA